MRARGLERIRLMSKIIAVLGPTNTGKTHYAIERMLGYRSGVMGFPLRLLAKEVYDKVVKARGALNVALVTGEERIVPPKPKYWICTVEAMPQDIGAEFVAIDEIQLCADPERGHIFTDRMLHTRGVHETVFLGAHTMRGVIAALIEDVEFLDRRRLSQLTYDGSRKISRLKPRSAIVGFSVDNVYATAELLRRLKGGAAVVMGALSPRTRNAQVEMYQNGEVDYLVATDAIGMGLNLDLNHVAFSALSKFDGRKMRDLAPNELAQIAGRAGRGMSDGTFGVTGDAPSLDEGMAQAIMEHRFTPIQRINWRSHDLNFATVDALLASLDVAPTHERLVKAREADDARTLRFAAEDDEVFARASDVASIRLLWDVCRIPDFRSISPSEHVQLISQIYNFLHEDGAIPNDWLARQIDRLDRPDGDIDAISKRLAYIRTWTYVAQRRGWVKDEGHWRAEAQSVEDRLSDVLHTRLTQRFVDRRTSVLLRRLNQKEALLANVDDKGDVTVEGEFVGRLEGFRFRPDQNASGQEAKTLKTASLQALVPHFHLRADKFYNAPDTEIDFTDQGGLMWGTDAVGKIVASEDPYRPRVMAFVDDLAGQDVVDKVQRRLQHFIDRKIAAAFEPLLTMKNDETLTGLARGFAFQLFENFGVIRRQDVADDVKALDQDARGLLRKHGVRFGQFTIFLPLVLKPAPTRMRVLLSSLAQGLDDFIAPPPAGVVTVPSTSFAGPKADTMSGYRIAGERAIRVDMLERLADLLRAQDTRAGFEANADMLSITGTTLEQFADLMQGLGYSAEKDERAKVKAAPASDTAVEAENVPDAAPSQEAGSEADAQTADTPTEDVPAEETQPDQDAAPQSATEVAAAAAPEMEVFYTFRWGRRPEPRQERRTTGDKPRGKPHAKGGQNAKGPKGKAKRPQAARPPKPEKKIDPDNPFAAALMGLAQKK